MQAANLFPPWITRAPRRLGALDYVILALFGLGVFSVVTAHEPWFDEAQGWLLAQDASVGELLVDFLRYEGHPPLWYMLLKTVGAVGLPYKAANVLSASLAVLGVILFLRLPALPLAIRCLVPFGFFIAYQFTVVARAYAMLFPIMMGIATIYPQRQRRPLTFALLLVLLSEVGLYGLALAWALAALYIGEVAVKKIRWTAAERRRHLAAAGLVLGHTLFMVAVLWPPSDLLIAPNLTQTSVLERYAAVAGRFETTCLLGSNVFSSLAWLGLLLWFWRQRMLATYLVLNLSTTVILGIYFNVWHEGFFFHSMLLCSLLALQHGIGRGLWRRAGLGLLLLIFGTHVVWGLGSWRYDLDEAFSASADLAAFLKFELSDPETEPPTVAAMGFPAIGLQPYFDDNLFVNYQLPGGHRFWDWSENNPLYYRPVRLMDRAEMRVWLDAMLAERPAYIVCSLKFPGDRVFEQWLEDDPDYRRIERFDGALFWKHKQLEWESFILYRRSDVESRRDQR
ncbi:MAG: hypothetical protein AAGE94_00220 [Acidobacteriota bacterium]